VVSAHWEEAPLAIGATSTVPLTYDFWGFPQHYHRVRYPAPGAPELAAKVRAMLGGPGAAVQDVPDRGLDHGAYVPLVEMYPGADIPTLQISMPTLVRPRCSASAGHWRRCGTRAC
jgi:4,5-DOPA dioxygenase extradiol